MQRLLPPPERDEGMAGFRSHCQAPQLAIAHLRQPGEQRVAAGGAQHLLGRPERIAASRGAHDNQMSQIDTGSRQSWGVRKMRRRKPHHALTRGS